MTMTMTMTMTAWDTDCKRLRVLSGTWQTLSQLLLLQWLLCYVIDTPHMVNICQVWDELRFSCSQAIFFSRSMTKNLTREISILWVSNHAFLSYLVWLKTRIKKWINKANSQEVKLPPSSALGLEATWSPTLAGSGKFWPRWGLLHLNHLGQQG